MVKFGVSPDVVEYSIGDLVKRAILCEDAGFDAIWEGDHTLPWHHTNGHCCDVIVALEAYLQATKRIMMVGLVPPLGIRRQPVDIALAFATMAVLHPGRVSLTVGAGEAMNEKTATGFWPTPRERVERVEEAIQLINMCWKSDDYFHFRGRYYDTFFYLYDKPKEPIPLYCAANGPRMVEVAGRYCQGFISVGKTPQEYEKELIPRFENAARKSGKDISKLDKIAWVSTFYHPDIEKAFKAARNYGGLLIPECYHNIQDPRIIEKRACEVDDKALAAAFNIASKPDDLITKFEAYIKAGCSYPVMADELKVIRGAARAQEETGAPFTIHPPLLDMENKKKILSHEKIVKIVAREGVNLEKFYLSHMDLTCSDDWGRVNIERHKKLMDEYPMTLDYDSFGIEGCWESLWPGALMVSDNERLLAIAELCEQGYEKQLMLSQDIYVKIFRTRYGGWGYAHILKHIIPRLRFMGVSEKQITTMIVDNPKRIFAYKH